MSAVSAPYHQGQSPWPDNQSQRPDRPPPIQFHNDDQAPRGNTALAWTLRIAGLLAVAVISGLVWWYIQNDQSGGDPTGYGSGSTQQQSTGVFDFTAELDKPQVDQECGEHSYDDVKGFLTETPCERLTRNVYVTTVEDRKIYTSVAVVRMADDEAAAKLRGLTDQNGTGNVNDLVREGVVKVDGLDALSKDGGYESAQQGQELVIVEASYDPGASAGGTDGELEEIVVDAIRLGDDMVAGSGG